MNYKKLITVLCSLLSSLFLVLFVYAQEIITGFDPEQVEPILGTVINGNIFLPIPEPGSKMPPEPRLIDLQSGILLPNPEKLNSYGGNSYVNSFSKQAFNTLIQTKAKQIADERNREIADLSRAFYKEQTLVREKKSPNGTLDGTVKWFTKKGKLLFMATYKGGALNGPMKLFYPEGSLQQELNYINGKTEGISKKYYRAGNLGEVCNYVNDKLHGTKTGYYKTGEVLSESSFINGKPTGLAKVFFPNGNPMYIFDFSAGEQNHTGRKYDYDGNLISTDTYRNGLLVNRKSYNKLGQLMFNQNY